MVVRFTPISEVRYNEWVKQQGKPRLIVTLLAAGFAAEQLAAVTDRIAAHGLNIESVRRLSGRPLLEDGGVDGRVSSDERSSIEMTVRGEVGDDRGLKSALMAAASDLKFDFSVQADTVYRRNRRLVAFDMDSRSSTRK